MSLKIQSDYRPKSNKKHYRRISEYVSIERHQDDDILFKLRQYRNQKTKTNSPVKETGFNNTEKSLFNSTRPVSANNAGSIFSALKTQEISSLKVNNSQVMMEKSVDRLYRGSRPAAHTGHSGKTPLFQLAEVVCEKKITEIEANLVQKDYETGQKLMTELVYLKPLRFDLELNWEIAHGKEIFPPEKKLGIYYALQEKINYNPIFASINSFSIDDIIKELKDCSRLFRDILRGVASKGCEDESILMEMIWKVMIRDLESYINLHEYSLGSVMECTRSKLRSISEFNSNKLRILKEEYEEKIRNLNATIAELTGHLNTVTKEKHDLAKSLNDKTKTLVELTEIESQEKACVDLRLLLNKLSSYITESETEQTKQVSTLNHLSFMIRAADILRKKPDFVNNFAQTEWQINESFLPPSNRPIVSTYPLYEVLAKSIKTPLKYNALTLCRNALENCDGNLNFFKELLIYLIGMYKDQDTIFATVRGIYLQLMHEENFSGKLFLKLLDHSKVCYLKIEQVLFKLNGLFIKESENNLMGLSKFIEFLQGHLPEERTFCEELLENISKFYLQKDLHHLLLFRFQLACERFGKNLKNILENDLVPISEFPEWGRNKLGWWVSNNDLNQFMSFYTTNIQVSALVSNENGIPDKIKDQKIEKDAFLLAFLNTAHEYHSKVIEQPEEYEKIKDFNIFKEKITKIQNDIAEKKISQGFCELILGTEISEIFEKTLEFEFVNVKIQEVLKQKKKAGKQAKKVKK